MSIKKRIIYILVLGLTVFLINTSLLPNNSPEFLLDQQIEVKGHESLNKIYFIFLNGLGSFYNDDVYVSMGFDNIRKSLHQLGFSFHDERFLLYSYMGGKVKEGQWQPQRYTAQDTGQSLHASIEKLGILFEEFTQVYPDAKFILVGHSLGGRIALDFVSTTTSHNKEKIIGVITLNSPLLGAGRKAPSFILDILSDLNNIYGSPVVRELIAETQYQQELANLRREAIKELQNNRIRIATFSTYQDYFVNPLTACVLDEKHQPISEGFIINSRTDLQDLLGHMIILKSPEIIKHILSLCLNYIDR